MGKSRVNAEQNQPGHLSKTKKKKLKLKAKRKKQLQHLRDSDDDPVLSGSDQDADEEENPSPEDLQHLLESYSKDQLVSFLADAAVDDSSLLSLILAVANGDVAHRKIFVHGLGWDVTTESLLEAFRPYGPIVDGNVVLDRVSGRNKGFGFVLFSTRAGAQKALKVREKKIGNRLVSCNLASIGNTPSASSLTPIAQRRIYVSNVLPDVSSEKLKTFFATFGEIESGPSGFDTVTGRSRGFAIFVYKTLDGATKALQEPDKVFEGRQLHCKLALDNSQKGKSPSIPVVPQSLPVMNQQPALSSVAPARNASMLNQNAAMLSQNPAMLSQNPALVSQNPAYNMLYMQNPLLTNAALNPNSIAALNSATLATFNQSASLITPPGQGYAGQGYGGQSFGGQGYGGQGYGGIGVGLGGSTMLGSYGALEGRSYGGSQLGQPSSGTPGNGFFGGFRH